ncbi:MAG: 16S rRNA (uracil(1498)-N(3))-methyltransferase [Betaproteobacteria bacterium RIFCSPLOWO2_12_FULL_64_23]|nr:MAG: 16S rRNA (uracil(1498)-N(3))-methyltransferase [Betaproteobacteria bacterium RIFCSPLOWO2_12_FULL_64_23]
MKLLSPRLAATRLYCDLPLSPGAEIVLPDAAARHAVSVLRLQVGDALNLFNGTGGEYRASLVAVNKRETRVRLIEFDATERESPVDITLALGISAGERMDYSLQKATELGVTAIQPLATERSVVKLAGERADKRLQHWQHVVIAACEQCGRNRVPAVAPVQKIYAYLAAVDRNKRLLMLSPDAGTPLKRVASAAAAVLLIGAEGGLAPSEYQAAQACGFEPVNLGPRILRTETAPVAALALLQALWGDL